MQCLFISFFKLIIGTVNFEDFVDEAIGLNKRLDRLPSSILNRIVRPLGEELIVLFEFVFYNGFHEEKSLALVLCLVVGFKVIPTFKGMNLGNRTRTPKTDPGCSRLGAEPVFPRGALHKHRPCRGDRKGGCLVRKRTFNGKRPGNNALRITIGVCCGIVIGIGVGIGVNCWSLKFFLRTKIRLPHPPPQPWACPNYYYIVLHLYDFVWSKPLWG